MCSVRLLLVFVVAIDVAACAVQQHPLTATAAASLKGRRVAMTARPPTPFFVTEPNKNHFNPYGLVGGLAIAAAMSDAGARIFRENGIADPAPYMAQQLSDDLRRRYGLKLEQQALYITDDDPKQITAAHPAADLLLDVWINSLSLEPFSHNPSKYRVRYTAYLRLIDAKIVHLIDGKKGLVIAHGTCSRIPEETSSRCCVIRSCYRFSWCAGRRRDCSRGYSRRSTRRCGSDPRAGGAWPRAGSERSARTDGSPG
jgi:hypothetical protein